MRLCGAKLVAFSDEVGARNGRAWDDAVHGAHAPEAQSGAVEAARNAHVAVAHRSPEEEAVACGRPHEVVAEGAAPHTQACPARKCPRKRLHCPHRR